MDALSENISRVVDGEDPTHFLSIFPTWLTRQEWEIQGYANVAEDEQEGRLSSRVSFFKLLHEKAPDGLLEIEDFKQALSADYLTKNYVDGQTGGIYASNELSLIVEPSYLLDDADSLWIFSRESLDVVELLAKSIGLFVLPPKS